MTPTRLSLALLVSVFLLPSTLPAVERTWKGTSSNAWSTPGNWGNGIPGSADVAAFNAVGAGNLNVSVTGNTLVGGLHFNDNAINNVNIYLANGAYLRLAGDIVIDAGSTGQHSITGDSASSSVRLGLATDPVGIYNYAITNNSAQLFSIATKVLDVSGGSATGRNLTVNGAGNVLIASTINGTAPVLNLFKDGDGILTLSSATGNTYGTTTITRGTLMVANTTNSATGSGSVTVKNGGTLGGTGRVAPTTGNSLTVESGGTLLAGTLVSAVGSLSVNGNVALQASSIIELTLGTLLSHTTLVRQGGTWSFDANQAFELNLLEGATVGTYDNVITGLASNPNVSGWHITTPSVTGSFVWDNGNVDLVVTSIAVPEPGTWLLLSLGAGALVLFRRKSGRVATGILSQE